MSRRNHRDFRPLKKNDPPIVFKDNCFQFISKGTTKKNKAKKENKTSNQKKAIILKKISTDLISTYYKCNKEFMYRTKMNPKRFITVNHKPRRNQGFDNSGYELILKVDDILVGRKDRFRVLDGLGSGTYGQVVKCQNLNDKSQFVAIKVIKNHQAYFNQALLEINILQALEKFRMNQKTVKYFHHFLFRNHLCIAYELLSVNLLQLLKLNRYRGFSIKIIRKLSTQLLDSLTLLYDTGIIHSDLKPENILLEHPKKTDIKIIDFGSACYCHQTNADYIQSRFYRAPEVIIKARYSQAIDMWSFGCIINSPPNFLKKGRVTTKYYNITDEEFRFKSIEQFSIENQIRATERRKYFNDTILTDIILKAPYRKKFQKLEMQKEIRDRTVLLHFLIGVLQIDPDRRWTPKEARQHPFITGEDFHPNFRPKSTRERIHYTLPKENAFNNNFNPKLQKLQKTELQKKKQENSNIKIEKQFSPQKRQSPKTKMRTRTLTRTRTLPRKHNMSINRKSKYLKSSRINSTDNNSQMLSQTSETSSLSEMESIPNFSLSGRFNSKSFLMPRSPQKIDSSSESDSSEFELYRNIRRAKRSFGFGFVSSSGTEEDFSNNEKKKKRRNKIKSWSDSREDPFSSEKNNDEIEIDLMNNPQNLRFAEKLNLNDKTTTTNSTTTTTTTTNSTNSTDLNNNTSQKIIINSKSTTLITLKKKKKNKKKKKYSKLKKKRNRLRKKKTRSISFKSSKLIKTTIFNRSPREDPVEITMKEPSSPGKKKKKKKSEKKKKKKKKNQSNNEKMMK
ncbi:homeodomain interacting protein kinase isoform a [Anaeramoeba flamelloides]|uniref:Homeodomain interacting protein kinase isoform a n=1 Tax=Anaeramoeba flamelloides TaxID=1746091 RepID=A0AAV7Z225_9EUKA|nr:homeodomain interacting protein kinase isoform a [Anaeramoeba flamelloides]